MNTDQKSSNVKCFGTKKGVLYFAFPPLHRFVLVNLALLSLSHVSVRVQQVVYTKHT